MKSSLKISCTLLLLFGCIQSPIQAMDDDKSSGQLSNFEQLPPEVLMRILSFVVESDPNAVGNLMKIQMASKKLQNILSDQQIKWIFVVKELNEMFLQKVVLY